jgi:hypothetical protein
LIRSTTPSSGATTPPKTAQARITKAPQVYHSKPRSDPFPEKSATSAIKTPSRISIPLSTIKDTFTAAEGTIKATWPTTRHFRNLRGEGGGTHTKPPIMPGGSISEEEYNWFGGFSPDG